MSCVDNVCGTGLSGVNNPKPGDPDNNVSLSANTVYGGINVSWSYPTTNPHAVAYTILYRGSNNTLAQAVELAKVGGSVFFDGLSPLTDTTYYYWIKIVSINGTVGEVIGPVSAIAKPRSTQTLESLTGLINDSVLANALKNDIARIEWVQTLNQLEIDNRIAAHSALAGAIANVQLGVDESLIVLQQEVTQRQTADEAIVQSVNIMTTAMNNNLAAFLEEQVLRTTKDEAYASNFTALYTRTGANEAAIINEQQVRTTADSAQAAQISSLSVQLANANAAIITEQYARATADTSTATQITSIQTMVNDNAAAIITEQNARTTADTATANSITSLQTSVGNNAAAIITETKARTTADEGLASQITTVQTKVANAMAAIQTEQEARATADSAAATALTTAQSTLNGNIASVQTGLQSQITTTNGKVTDIGALYTAKISVNGLVGGFGIYNNGYEIDAGFDVDRFWIGRSLAGQVKPFIVDGSTVYIDKARIRNADIDTLKLAGNAVTIPVLASSPNTTVGNGSFQQVLTGSLYLDEPGVVFAATTGQIAYGQGWVPAGSRMKINGITVSDGGGEEAYMYATHSGGVYCNAGSVTVTLEFYGLNNKARIINPSMFIQAVKR